MKHYSAERIVLSAIGMQMNWENVTFCMKCAFYLANTVKWLRTSGITAGIPVAAPLHHMDERLMHPEERRKQWRRAMQAD
jgi:hypothetical protein